MMKKFSYLLLSLIFLGGVYGTYLYNKPVQNAAHKSVDARLTSRDLFKAFENDEKQANSNFLNKILVVSGEVVRVTQEGQDQNIFLKTDDMLSTVSCEMSSVEKGIAVGEVVSIKGQCSGFLMDVVLTKCVKSKS